MSLIGRIRQLLSRLTPGGGLAEQTTKSGIWAVFTNVADRALQLLMVIILGRLLSPSDFGLLGIALLTLTACRRFSKLGFDEALIQNSAVNVDSYLNTFWSMEFIRGLLLAGVLLVSAPFVASLFSEPRAEPLIRVIAITPVLLGLKNPGIVYFKKDLNFHKQFAYTMSGSVVNFTVAVALAIATRSLWALVIGYIASDAARLVASYLTHDYRPRPALKLDAAKEMFGFGKWMTGSGMIFFLVTQGDDAVVGWLLTAASLGFYQVAYRFAVAPATEISQVISTVAFPAYSQLQDDISQLRAAFYRTLQVTAFVAFPISIGIAVVAPTFVEATFGQEWIPMVPVMQIVAVHGLLIAVGATYAPIWKALGRPDLITKLGVIRLVSTGLLIVPATQEFGIVGAAGAVLGAYVIPIVPLDLYIVVQSVETSLGRLLVELSYPAAASLLMGGVVFWLQNALALNSALLELGLLIAVGAGVYAAAVAVLETQLRWGLRDTFGRFMNTI
jgi:PST family polysaccharide transporter/lipopolysaccharide exporter